MSEDNKIEETEEKAPSFVSKYVDMIKQNKGFLIEKGITIIGGLLGFVIVAVLTGGRIVEEDHPSLAEEIVPVQES